MVPLQLVNDLKGTSWGDTAKWYVDLWQSVTAALDGSCIRGTRQLRKISIRVIVMSDSEYSPWYWYHGSLDLCPLVMMNELVFACIGYPRPESVPPPWCAIVTRFEMDDERGLYIHCGGGWEVAEARPGRRPTLELNCNLACAREARELCFSGGLFLVPTNPAHRSGTRPFDAPT